MKKRLLSLVLVLCVLCALLPIGFPMVQAYSETDFAYPVEGGNIYFDKTTGTITGCDQSVTKVEIPSEIDGVAVTSIGEGAFFACESISNITIPDSVTTVGEMAFWQCLSLSSVTLGKNITSIESGTFHYCASLTSVKIPNRVTSIGDGAFYLCTSLSSVEIPDSVVRIGDNAFYECSSLKSIEIPKSVISIGESAFGNCTVLTGVWVNGDNPAFSSDSFGVLFNKDKKVLLLAPCKTSGIYAIPNGVTTIGKEAFSGCTALTRVEIPCTVTNIEKYAFAECVSLSSAVIPSSVISIGDGAFLACDSLTSMVIPKKTTSIGSSAFYGCDALTSVEIKGSVTKIADHTFFGCRALETVIMPDSILSIDWNAFYACESLVEITLGENVTSIGSGAFCGCESLTSLTLGENLTHIGENAFWHSSSLHSVFFKGEAPTIGEDVFRTWDFDAEQTINIPELTLYYLEGKKGWTSPTWNGYPTATWELPHEHLYTATVTAPTCTEKGYTTYNCECGDRYIDTYVDALGHSYENGVCVRCGEKKPQPPVEFVDVPKNEWYADAVAYAVQNGLMNGVGNDRFDPEGSMTRAMLVTVLWRYEGEPEAGSNSFRDVLHGQWYTDAVSWAAANGVVNGVGNGRFDPEGKITREQMATILFRYAQKKGADTSKRGNLGAFPDGTKVSAYAEEAVQWTVGEGVINGSDGKLLPQGSATRAQVATILMRYIENIVKR